MPSNSSLAVKKHYVKKEENPPSQCFYSFHYQSLLGLIQAKKSSGTRIGLNSIHQRILLAGYLNHGISLHGDQAPQEKRYHLKQVLSRILFS